VSITSQLYIRNAVEDPTIKPKPANIEWGKTAEIEVDVLRKLINGYKPQLILCFGAFAFEFARPRTQSRTRAKFRLLGCTKARGRVSAENQTSFTQTLLIPLPLLHRSIFWWEVHPEPCTFCAVEGAITSSLLEITSQIQLIGVSQSNCRYGLNDAVTDFRDRFDFLKP